MQWGLLLFSCPAVSSSLWPHAVSMTEEMGFLFTLGFAKLGEDENKDSVVLIALETWNLYFLDEVDSGTEANYNLLFSLSRQI